MECAQALLKNQMPEREASLFAGSVLMAWLETGGAFEKHARVGAKKGSHHTHTRIFQSLISDESVDKNA